MLRIYSAVLCTALISSSCEMSVTDPRHLVPYLTTFEVGPRGVAIYTTAQTQMHLIAYLENSPLIEGLRETWKSSNTSIATVDRHGVVTGLTGGVVTITATTENRSASTDIIIVPRPTADWTRVTEDWTAYQGNNHHNGYVPAVLDPLVFEKAWRRTDLGAGGTRGVAAGGGMLFVASAGDRLWGLDISTGETKWFQDFEGEAYLSHPAYSNGSVFAQHGSRVYGHDAITGEQRFRTQHDAIRNNSSRGPIVEGGRLFVSAGFPTGGIYSLNFSTGARRWFVAQDGVDRSPTAMNGKIYAYTAPSFLVFDAETGARAAPIVVTASNPGAGMVVACNSNWVIVNNGQALVAIRVDPRETWVINGPHKGMPVCAKDMVYAIHNNVVEVRHQTSGALIWSWSPPASETLRGDMIVTDNLLFVAGDETTYAVDLNVHKETWRYPAAGMLALSNQGYLLISSAMTALRVK
jgi:outer membrane protein assembly factor BamB